MVELQRHKFIFQACDHRCFSIKSRYPDAPEMDAVVMVNPEILEFSQSTCLVKVV
jgi:hypothetical protein